MAAPRRKKARIAETEKCEHRVLFPETNIFIVDRKMTKTRHDFLQALARRKGFAVCDQYGSAVTHIVAEDLSTEQVMEYFHNKGVTSLYPGQELLTMEWFTKSMEEKQPVPCTDHLRLKPAQAAVPVSTEKMTLPKHECQRITRLKHHNHRFTTALEVLEEHAGYLQVGQKTDSRARAFRRAACSLKALPHPLTNVEEARTLPHVGTHSLSVIQDILEDGYSQEVQDISDGDFYGTMQLFTGIFGVGSATARKWYERGFRTLDDIRNDSTLSLKKDQTIGLELYQDLNTPVTLAEADIIQEMVRAEVQKLLPGATVVLTGGFRRGKTKGHDVDLLISHPTEGKETGLLSAVLAKLREKDLLAYETTSANTYDPSSVSRKEYTLDHFERCFSIFKLDKSLISSNQNTKQAPPSPVGAVQQGSSRPDLLHHKDKVSLERAGGTASFLDEEKTEEKTWIGRRVDLIIAPASQYAYALVGWTGSKHFNRSLRLYADNEMNMKLTNHVLYDSVKNQYLPASSEEDVFLHLQLPYREPAERNC
ncbi:DNA-directed DNA/RNA polymerase mu-like [Branchiostoma floridae]|uniref:DNA-directed DNA/RNA polymerase mu n=1 Tax=Branchiostoma floridae TaxID=7739 RepID=A0A9J7L0V4_BRAFL|nr:DNA-directed DNA/RNA polymerase mu-like [Branchiostoma floridae]